MLFVLQLKVTPTPWPPKAMMWTTTEELHSEYCRAIILWLWSVGICACVLTMCIISGLSWPMMTSGSCLWHHVRLPLLHRLPSPGTMSERQMNTPALFIMLIWEFQDITCFSRMPRDYNEDEDPAARRRKKKRSAQSCLLFIFLVRIPTSLSVFQPKWPAMIHTLSAKTRLVFSLYLAKKISKFLLIVCHNKTEVLSE